MHSSNQPTTHQIRASRQLWVLYAIAGSAALSLGYAAYIAWALRDANLTAIQLTVLGLRTSVEVMASIYSVTFLLVAIGYALAPKLSSTPRHRTSRATVGAIYLCADDLEVDALESLLQLEHDGELVLVVHDDSRTHDERKKVDEAIDRLRGTTEREILLLRRDDRRGGKPGAVNHAMERTRGRFDFILLCDSDSTVLDPTILRGAMGRFADEKVAAVQLRSRSLNDPRYCWANRQLARATDMFHVFLSMFARHGWTPFIGHNAVLRMRAIEEAGGMTPGFFADDIDLTVRMNMLGYRVEYAPELVMGEGHPPNYWAFRSRTYKWAYGCIQVLRRHGWAVARSRRFSLAEKLSFFLFSGFYVWQTILIGYVVIAFGVSPFVLNDHPISIAASLGFGLILIALIYLPVTSYWLREGDRNGSLTSVTLCYLIYGAADFSAARGTIDCLTGRKRSWVPTNIAGRRSRMRALIPWFEASFGGLLLAIPALVFPALLYLPSSYLFLAKFLFGPAMAEIYDDRFRTQTPSRMAFASGALLAIFALLLIGFMALPGHAKPPGRVEVRGKSFVVDGDQFTVRGIHYGPWRAGTGPGKGYPYPATELLDEDLELIQATGANTILAYDAPRDLLDAAHRRGMLVLYAFSIDWWTLGTPAHDARSRSILDAVEQQRDHPAILAWIVGHEIPAPAVSTRGESAIVKGLEDLRAAVRKADPVHLITHSGWPPTRGVAPDTFDFASFNVYPLWPPEVVAMGFGTYIRDVLQPLAGNRPLLITEFGVNSLEASEQTQASLLHSSWDALVAAGAAGGVVFEFADEWWKNYNNPIREGSWWDREYAPDDELSHDLDPEEHYGIVTSTREPKQAFAEVTAMFSGAPAANTPSWVPIGLSILIVGCALVVWIWARLSRHPR